VKEVNVLTPVIKDPVNESIQSKELGLGVKEAEKVNNNVEGVVK